MLLRVGIYFLTGGECPCSSFFEINPERRNHYEGHMMGVLAWLKEVLYILCRNGNFA